MKESRKQNRYPNKSTKLDTRASPRGSHPRITVIKRSLKYSDCSLTEKLKTMSNDVMNAT